MYDKAVNKTLDVFMIDDQHVCVVPVPLLYQSVAEHMRISV